MIAHVIGRRRSFRRVLGYLAGPGHNREHENPRIVTADRDGEAFIGAALDRETVRLAAANLDSTRRTFKSPVREPVWHATISLPKGERFASDAQRRDVAEGWMREMGIFDRCAWVAVDHGASKGGYDHLHVVASCVRDDGRAVRLGKDRTRATDAGQKVARDFGLRVLPSHEAGLQGMRDIPRVEIEAAARAEQPNTMDDELHRRVRAAKAESRNPDEFMQRVRAHGVEFRPRYAKGSTTDMTGYSVRLPVEGARWYKGGNLAHDLSMPRLKEAWASRPLAHEAAGAFASMSRAHERDPGPMWQASREIARSAQTRQATGAAANGLRLAALLAQPEKGPAEWLAIGALAIGAAQQLHATHVANGHQALAGELERVKGHWTSAKADLTAAAAVEPARAPWLGQSRSTERGIGIE